MKDIYILDWLISKPIRLKVSKDINVKYWDKIIYQDISKFSNSELIWSYIWYKCDSYKDWKFIWILKEDDLVDFNNRQQKAIGVFKEKFKNEFKSYFEASVPITARYNYTWDILYFYFYAEERFDFKEFLPHFRKKVDSKFFLFQVWARDRIRMDPFANNLVWSCWKILCCKSDQTPLPTVENDNIDIQDLHYRWVEKLKWRCWKLKCCLNYEKDLYNDELKKFPSKWTEFSYNWCKHECCWVNIMTWMVVAKDLENDHIKKVTLDEYNESVK